MWSALISSIEFTPLEVLYTCIFCLFVFGSIYPPLEFIAAGVTLENIFGQLLGRENVFFVQYHLRRTTLVRVVWSFYLLLYYCVMRMLSEHIAVMSPRISAPFCVWDLVLWVGLLVATVICTHTYLVWYALGSWSGHPTVIQLKSLVADLSATQPELCHHSGWITLASNINSECSRTGNFVASHGVLSGNWAGRRLIVTDTWILSSHFTRFNIIKQSDQLLAIVVSASSVPDTGSFTEGGRPAGEGLGTQVMVTVRFVRVESGKCLLSFSLPASSLESLRSKLRFRLIHAEGVELEPTVVQRFIKAFTEVVAENGSMLPPGDMELDLCVGCLNSPANVVLSQRCDPSAHASLDAQLGSSLPVVPPCGVCRCRPMWCLECLGRWFASRQIESHRPTSVWLSGRVPCPTCRSIFCVRDVVPLADLTVDS